MARSYRFFIDFENLGQTTLSLSPQVDQDLFHQITKVLRIKPGDTVIFLNSKLRQPPYYEYFYTVQAVDKREIHMTFNSKKENVNEFPLRLEIVLCLPNSTDKLRFVLEKAVELGVATITLVTADHSRLQQKLRSERLSAILKEAAEQSERGLIPEVNLASSLRQYLEYLDKNEINHTFVAMERSGKANVKTLEETLTKGETQNVLRIVVGPEGGFSDEEKTFIQSTGFPIVSLGERILRYETAVIVMLGIVTVI